MSKQLIDVVCTNADCRHEREDVWRENGVCPSCEFCGSPTERLWRARASGHVIGDEIDVTVRHGLCHADGTPRRFRSREELRRAERNSGWTNVVQHVASPGTDKNPHTQRFV